MSDKESRDNLESPNPLQTSDDVLAFIAALHGEIIYEDMSGKPPIILAGPRHPLTPEENNG